MKIGLTKVLITAGIVIWLSVAFYIFKYRYSQYSSPERISFYDLMESVDDYPFEIETKSKMTLILLEENKFFVYYGNAINNGKLVTANETSNLIQDGWKMFSNDSFVVIIKPTRGTTHKLAHQVSDKISKKYVKRYFKLPDKSEKEFLKLDE